MTIVRGGVRAGRMFFKRVLFLACAGACCFYTLSNARGEDKPEEKKPAQSVKMEFKEAALDTVLEQLSDATGLVIVKGEAIEGKITIISKQAMNLDEAIGLLNTVLKEKGYVGIRTGKILKIVKLEDAKKRNIPVRTGSDPEKIEANDEVVTQVIQIKYVDAVQLKKDFTPLIPSYAELTANAASNTLLITDTNANIKRLMEMIRSIDTQTSTVAEVKVFQLKYANAASAARLITDLFKPDTNQQQGGGQNPFNRFRGFGGGFGGGGGGGPGGGGGGTDAAADTGSHKQQKVTASSDERTNTIVVSAAPDTLKVIEGIIKDLDSNPAAEQAVFMYRCKNAQAKNLESVLNTLFGTGSGGSGSRSTTSTNRGSGTSGGLGQGSQRGSSSGFGGGGGSGGSSGLGGSSGFGSTSTQLPGVNQGSSGGSSGFGGRSASTTGANANTNDLTGQVFVVADTDTNALMVLTPSKNFDRVKTILTSLDRPVPQVVIKVLIAEVTHDKTNDTGVDVSVLTKGTVKNALTNFGVAAQTTGFIAKIVKDDVSVALRALATEGKLEVLSRPYIVCSDNQQSSITIGQIVPFIVSSNITALGGTVNNIQYQDIGIILNVTAHINDDGLVIMDVAPEVSSITGQTVKISDTLDAPVFAKRSAQSRVGVRDGQTVVIGGMMEDKRTDTNQGIPGLRNIPGLGNLFGRKQSDKSKTELIIFLTPHVAMEPDFLEPLGKAETDGLKLLPKAVKPGTYWEHRQGLERGGATMLPLEGSDNGLRIEAPEMISTPPQVTPITPVTPGVPDAPVRVPAPNANPNPAPAPSGGSKKAP